MKSLISKLLILSACVVCLFAGAFCIFPDVQDSNRIKKGQGGFETSVMPVLSVKEEIDTSHIDIQDSLVMAESSVPADELSYIAYRVKKGDMIGIIAEDFGVTQDTIISVNNIRQSRLLQIGQYLKIPSMPGILYTVRDDGEQLDAIAKKYEISLDKCAKVNNLALDCSLSAGKTLFLPDAELDWVTRQEINGDLFTRPIRSRYYFSSYWGWRSSPFNGKRSFHGGIDMAAGTGTNIYAALDGTVVECAYNATYGNYVVIKHHSGYRTLYAHMSKITTKVGRYVYSSTKIGEVGNTGLSTGPHLHFAVYKNGASVNPQNLWK